MIKIGVTAGFLYPDPNRASHNKKTLTYFERDMSRYLSRKGVMPILIPDLQSENLYEFLSEMDGFVFQGGADIAPQTYGEQPILDGKWKGDPERDVYELRIMDFAVKNDKPVLAICRGFQLMNVYFGGTLYQDLLTQKNDSILHRDAEIYDRINHEIEIIKGGLLEKLFPGVEHPHVNSVHHQGVKDLGKDLKVLAVCKNDNLVEAFTYTKAPEGKIMGVQWHPEFFHTIKDSLIDADALYLHFLSFIKN